MAHNIKRMRPSQGGAALVVGLVVLLMLTLLGVSSMNMTSLELRVSGNTMNRNNVFQSSASLIDHVYDATGADPYRMDFVTTVPVQTLPNFNHGSIQATPTIVFADGPDTGRPPRPIRPDCSALTRSTLSATCVAYEIRVTSVDGRSNANSSQVQGLIKLSVIAPD